MSLRFTVLASGSGGNASLVEAGGFGVLIDAGLGPRQLGSRLAAAGLSWAVVKAVLLTHTHCDHWKDRTLDHLHRRHIPLYCHPEHHPVLLGYSTAFPKLLDAGLAIPYESRQEISLAPGLRVLPLPLRHDGGATFGFRLEGAADLFGRATAVAYAADLGCWDETLADHLADVDLLALEFNHDVALECASGRTPRLIERVLGDDGHLSNDQAANLVRAVLARSQTGRLRHLVQLHLSNDCNRPTLAREAAQTVLADLAHATLVHTALQDSPTATLDLSALPVKRRGPRRAASRRAHRDTRFNQLWLPGMETA